MDISKLEIVLISPYKGYYEFYFFFNCGLYIWTRKNELKAKFLEFFLKKHMSEILMTIKIYY